MKCKVNTVKRQRNSSIEALKVFGILLIIVSHLVQTLGEENGYLLLLSENNLKYMSSSR
jgi:fucose 4-O-acetylase-like acetyltransferase